MLEDENKSLGGPYALLGSKDSSEDKRSPLRFIHVTKCAGSSIESVSQKSWGKHDMDYCAATCEIYTDKGSWWHVPLRLAKAHVLRDLLKKFDYFIVVRNPFERVVSEFYCPWGGPGKKSDTDVYVFNAWISEKLEGLSSSPPMHGHWAPQYLYVEDGEGKLIVQPSNVIFMESLDTQYASLMKRYSLSDTYALRGDVHVNQSQDKKFCAADLDSRNIELVTRVYDRDFEYFGYDRVPPPRKEIAAAPAAAPAATVAAKAAPSSKDLKPKPLARKAAPALDSKASFADLLATMNKRRKTD